jgi:hypothetical protein
MIPFEYLSDQRERRACFVSCPPHCILPDICNLSVAGWANEIRDGDVVFFGFLFEDITHKYFSHDAPQK